MPDPQDRPKATGARAVIPNALTVGRLFLAGGFFALLELGLRAVEDPWNEPDDRRSLVLLIALGVFVIAALTDALDGYLARKWNAISKFGRVMDPFADKILVLGAFVYLAAPAFTLTGETPHLAGQALSQDGFRSTPSLQVSGVAPWMVVLILARELLVTSVRGFFESQGVDFSADLAGKLKMILQSAVVPLILLLLALADPTPGSPARWVIDTAVWLTVLVTLVSCAPYVLKGITSGRGLIHEPEAR